MSVAISGALTPRNTSPSRVFEETTSVTVAFNIMPGRRVEETLYCKEYRVWDDYGEATFSRKYLSEMEQSPSHLIALTALCHTQKLLYVCLCHRFGIEYNAFDKERIKIWPMEANIKMPSLITRTENLIQRIAITAPEQRGAKTFQCTLQTIIDDSMEISANVPFVLL